MNIKPYKGARLQLRVVAHSICPGGKRNDKATYSRL
jgi:hypothetical protein